MITRMVEERIGEWLGPVDWSYDFTKHDWTGRNGGRNPACSSEGVAVLRKMAASPEGWTICPSGFTSFRVVHVGMYDGWPFWEPTPAIGYIGPLGGVEVKFFYSLSEHEVRQRPEQAVSPLPATVSE